MVIGRTAVAEDVGRAWDAFMVRKVMATAWEVGLVPDTVLPVRFPPLRLIIAALLYLELVSLLDYVCATQTAQKVRDLNDCINTLDSEGKLLDAAALHTIRKRRNEIAHEVECAVDVSELDAAISAVHRQFEAWRLIGAASRYEPFAERSAAKESDRLDYSCMWHWTVGVKRADRPVLRFEWDEYLAKDGAS